MLTEMQNARFFDNQLIQLIINSVKKKFQRKVSMAIEKKKIKKWTKEEIGKVLDYLEENPKFEHPTAQMFYKKFLDSAGIDASWQVVKFKVRYLKTKLKEAEKWRTSTGAGISEIDQGNGTKSIKEKLNKICPFYDRMNALFIPRHESVVMENFDTTNSIESISIVDSLEADECNSSYLPQQEFEVEEIFESPSTPLSALSEKEKRETFPKRLRTSTPKDAVSALTKMQEERTKCMQKKFKFDEEKFSKELEFEKEKFEAEMSFKEKELALKQFEIEQTSKERQHRLELEKEERLARYELELKYKCTSMNN